MTDAGAHGPAASPEQVKDAVADAHRREWGFVLAATARVAGSLDVAEECVQDAYGAALDAWLRDGVPRSPGAWLTTTARRRALDVLRREQTLRRKLPLDDVLFCPYDDVTHPCRKPQPGMFLEAAFKWNLDLDRSFVVSDKWSDAKAAQLVGCTSIMLESPWIGDDHHDFVVSDLAAAVAKIEQLHHNVAACEAA